MTTGPPGSEDRGLLEACVGDLGHFRDEVFGRRPQLHRGEARHASQLGAILTIDDVDALLTGHALRAPAYRLVQEGRTVPRSATTRTGRVGGVRVDDLPDVGRIAELVHGGATLVLQSLHRSWPAVTRLCRQVEDALGHPVQANAYLTPPGNRGLDVHHDTHDVLAVQLSGSKHWVVHEPAVPSALPSQRWSRDHHRPGLVVIDDHLVAGDCLYLPSGTPHAAESTDEVSLHLTVGIRAVTWLEVLQRVVEGAAEEERFRRSLPPGATEDADVLAEALAPVLQDLAAWVEERDPRVVAEAEVTRFHAHRPARLEGQLRRVLEVDAVDVDTVVRRRPGVPVRVTERDDRLRVELTDREVDLPATVADETRCLLAGPPVRVGDLDGRLDGPGRVVLARRLVREGAIEVVRPGAPDG